MNSIVAKAENPGGQKVDLRVWLADLTYTQQQISAELIPQGIGGIATFAETQVRLPEPIRLFKYPEALAAALAQGPIPQVIGFSNYLWNSNLACAFARRIRALSPSTVIVFGGPNYPVVPAEQEAFLRARPEIDFYVIKEGELAFSRLLTALGETGCDVEATRRMMIPSVHAIGADGTALLSQTIERITDLSLIPSPYCTGRLDEFFDGKLLPIIQTNRGCPFNCTFCVEGVPYYSKVYRNGREKVAAEIAYIGSKMAEVRKKGGRNDLFIADSNFGMYKEDIDTCRDIAKAQDDYRWPEYINVATGKNQKARVLEAARLVRGAIRLSGSVQSLNGDVLKNIRRDNISGEQLIDLALSAAEIDANSYSEIILGLPGDTKAAHFATLRGVIEAGFNKVIPYTLMILPGSDMATLEQKRTYGMDLRYRVLPRCFGHYDICGERVVAAEIEEVCVATNTLSYEDYLACRRMHLLVSIFYNDGVFSGLLKFLRRNGLSAYGWLDALNDATPAPGLARLFDRFEQATRTELWPSHAQVEEHILQPGVVERYLAGELGLNLLFTFKSIAMTRHVDELRQLATAALLDVMAKAGMNEEAQRAFATDLVSWDACRMSGIFDDNLRPVEANIRFDIGRYLADETPGAAGTYELPRMQRQSFTMDDAQRDIIARGIRLFGSDEAGIGRILSKFHITRLLRRAENDQSRVTGTAGSINLHDS